MTCSELLPVVLYVLLSILIFTLIVFIIHLISLLRKVNNIVEDVKEKQKKLNKAFDLVDKITDDIALISDKLTTFAVQKLSTLFKNKKEKKEDE
jgi:hypothetical protein